MKTKTRSLTLMAILIAVMLLMGYVPNLGFIMIGPISITLMCIPVIIATLVLGLKTGLMMGLLFAVISISKIFVMPDAFSAIVVDDFGRYGVLYMLCLLIPRILIPVTTWGMGKAMKTKKEYANLAVASLAGSLTNTAVYLILVSLTLTPLLCTFYSVDAAGTVAVIWGIVLTNGLPEAVFATLICPAIARALKKSVPPIMTARQKEIA